MNILLIGNGAREHAVASKIAESPLVHNIYVIHGNEGTAQYGLNVSIDMNNFSQIKMFVLENDIAMIIIGPETPLVEGIVDFFKEDKECAHLMLVGPNKKAAQLEGSKEFAKQFMASYNIPTAKFKSFTKDNITEAYEFLKTLNAPYVLKVDGLAAGKGVLIIDNIIEAEREIANILLHDSFGKAGEKIVIEEFLNGIEMSYFIATDGNNYVVLPSAKDYKRIGEGDTGLNTGGMGAISPVPFLNKILEDKILTRIVKPTINGLKTEGVEYKGFIFIGLMIVDDNPYVIEYNVRLGDPETEVILPRIKSDFLSLCIHINNGTLSEYSLETIDKFVATVIIASKGYPEKYETDNTIYIGKVDFPELLFYAGVKRVNNELKTNGGRVLAVGSMGDSLENALRSCYNNIKNINFEGAYFRHDIGKDMIRILKKNSGSHVN